MKLTSLLLMFPLAIIGLQTRANAQLFSLGNAQSFAVLGDTTVTNTGPSVITGNLGVSPGTSVTGFNPPGTVTGTIYTGTDMAAQEAHTDVITSYNALAAMTPTQNLTGQDLGGLTLTPGVYDFSSSAALTGTLTLNFQGNPNALFVFQVGSTLITASSASVVEINNSSSDAGNVFFQVGSSATLGTGTDFAGTIVANQSITLDNLAAISSGRALAEYAAVTLNDNNVSNTGSTYMAQSAGTLAPSSGAAAPEPGAVNLLFAAGIPLCGTVLRRRLRR